MVAPSFAPYTSYGPRAALPGGPDELAYTPEEVLRLLMEDLGEQLINASQQHYDRSYCDYLTRRLGDVAMIIHEIEQHAGGYRA